MTDQTSLPLQAIYLKLAHNTASKMMTSHVLYQFWPTLETRGPACLPLPPPSRLMHLLCASSTIGLVTKGSAASHSPPPPACLTEGAFEFGLLDFDFVR